MKPNRILLAITLLVYAVLPVWAFDFEVADSAYAKGNFEEAAALYQQALAQEGMSAGLLYNLGNSFYRLGKDGQAMVCYERAKKLDPGNPLINSNLTFLSAKVREANKGALEGKAGNVEPDDETFMEGIYRLIAIETRSNSWAVFAVMAFLLFLGGVAMYIFTPNVLARKTGFFSGLVFFFFTVIFLIFAYMGADRFNRQDEAVLMEFTTRLLQQPEEKAKPSTSPLHKGTKLKILDTKKGADGTEWIRVKLNSDNVGWLKKQDIEVI